MTYARVGQKKVRSTRITFTAISHVDRRGDMNQNARTATTRITITCSCTMLRDMEATSRAAKNAVEYPIRRVFRKR